VFLLVSYYLYFVFNRKGEKPLSPFDKKRAPSVYIDYTTPGAICQQVKHKMLSFFEKISQYLVG